MITTRHFFSSSINEFHTTRRGFSTLTRSGKKKIYEAKWAYLVATFCAREEKVMATRLVCKSCNQELGRSSFYRHLTDDSGSVCPGKVTTTHAELSQSSYEESQKFIRRIWTLTTLSWILLLTDCESVSSVSSSLDTESSGDEVMIESDSESEEDEGNLDESNAANIISGIILFFHFFHLGYKLSERVIIVLMNFVKSLLYLYCYNYSEPFVEESC